MIIVILLFSKDFPSSRVIVVTPCHNGTAVRWSATAASSITVPAAYPVLTNFHSFQRAQAEQTYTAHLSNSSRSSNNIYCIYCTDEIRPDNHPFKTVPPQTHTSTPLAVTCWCCWGCVCHVIVTVIWQMAPKGGLCAIFSQSLVSLLRWNCCCTVIVTATFMGA